MIYLLRHGEVVTAREWRFVGQIDVALTDLGHNQAAWWGRELAGVEFEKVYASDLSRAMDTAAGVVGEGVAIEPAPGLREIDLGQWEGLNRAEVEERFPGMFAERMRDLATFRPPGGESFAEQQTRTVAALKEIMAGATGDVLVVAHSGTNRTLLCHYLGLPLSRLFSMGQGYCCLNTFVDDRRLGWRVESVNIPCGVAAE